MFWSFLVYVCPQSSGLHLRRSSRSSPFKSVVTISFSPPVRPSVAIATAPSPPVICRVKQHQTTLSLLAKPLLLDSSRVAVPSWCKLPVHDSSGGAGRRASLRFWTQNRVLVPYSNRIYPSAQQVVKQCQAFVPVFVPDLLAVSNLVPVRDFDPGFDLVPALDLLPVLDLLPDFS